MLKLTICTAILTKSTMPIFLNAIILNNNEKQCPKLEPLHHTFKFQTFVIFYCNFITQNGGFLEAFRFCKM